MKHISDKTKISIVFFLVLMLAIFKDISSNEIQNGVISRPEMGTKGKELILNLGVDNVIADFEYSLEVPSVLPTKETAEKYFAEVVSLIQTEFQEISVEVPLRKTYLEGKVKASWSFHPFGVIGEDGKINQKKLETEETIIQAQVELRCGNYEKIYQFPFSIKKPELLDEELVLQEIEKNLEKQIAAEGSKELELPSEINGHSLRWSEEKEYLTPQIILLETLAIILFKVFTNRKQKAEEKKKLQEMEREYADIVCQLGLLLGAGMTTKQAWNRIAMQYIFKRKNHLVEEKSVYEAILRMNGRLAEGVGERMAYQQFREEIPASCYHKLIRILLGNLETGARGVVVRLEEESRLAFEQKIILEKKRGEEASTKMLGPLMFMLIIVMAIIIIPAWLGFQL